MAYSDRVTMNLKSKVRTMQGSLLQRFSTWRRQLLRLSVLFVTCIAATSLPTTAQTPVPFRLFENLFFSGGPREFQSFGFEHLTIADPHVLGYNVPMIDQVRKALALPRENQYLAIDIEHWPLTGTEADRDSSIANYQATLSAIRQADPNLKLGLYNVLPVADYWRAIGARGEDGLKEWRSRNTEIASALIPHVDMLFPSLYTPYGDQDAWVTYAQANIEEARRISQGRPVYCFLWPQFPKTLAFLPGEFWYAELDTCRRLADGIVIWGTSAPGPTYRPMQWDENAEWWQATLRFLRELGKVR
ncbi:hypothetical protein NKH91_13145 [Mesorhizobium sp. M0894]|uniref:hypothetical protein n=1 Tax=unclassified Mesorhizobium TaxID=325217 RepID=UPI00333D390E